MILDHENMFSKAQAITTTAASSDVIDLGPNQWAGNSNGATAIPIILSVDESFTAAGAATLTVTVQHSADNSAWETSHVSKALSIADLTVPGKVPMALDIPPDAKRYVRLNYTVATGPFTAGKLTAGVVASRQTNR